MSPAPSRRSAAAWPAAVAAAAALAVVAGWTALEPGSRGSSELWPLGRTLVAAATAAGVALAAGVAYATWVATLRLPGRRLLGGLGVAPLVVPPYLAAVGWRDLLGPAGKLTRLVVPPPTGPSLLAESWLYTPLGCGLVLGTSLFPLVLLAAWAALARVDPARLEAARLLRGPAGARRIRRAALGPHALAAALLVFALAAVEFSVPQLLMRGRPVQAEEVYRRMAGEHDPGRALAAAVPLLALAGTAAGLAAWAWVRRPLEGGRGGAPPGRVGAAGAVGGVAGCLLLIAPGVGFPVASLALRLAQARVIPSPEDLRAGVVPPEPGLVGRALSGLGQAWATGREDAWNSVLVGAGAATAAVLLALVAAWALRRVRAGTGAAAVVVAAAGLAALPPPLVATGVLVAFNRPGLDVVLDGLAAVGLTSVLRFLPVALLVVWAAVRRLPASHLEAARLAGRGRGAAFGRVAAPQLAPGLAAAWAIVYVLTVTEYGASVLVAPPGASVLAVFTVNEAHYGQGDVLAGLCAMLLGVVALPGALLGLALGLRALAARARGERSS